MIIKNHFHNKCFALGLVLKQRLAASWKWPIPAQPVTKSLKVAQSSFLTFLILILWGIDATTLFHLYP